VRLLDLLLGDFMGEIAAHPLAGETLLAVTSPRGFPLGEHGRIGPCDHALYGEILHTPLLIRFPETEGALARTQQLVQTCDLAPTIADACGWLPTDGALAGSWGRRSLLRVVRGEAGVVRDRAIALSADNRAIRTPAWFLRESPSSAVSSGSQIEIQHELFVKPDDRWEANEVASRCGEVAAQLGAEIDDFTAARLASRQEELSPLAEVLRNIQR
jgi:arylsulfatase A-like enzyme